MGIPSKRIIVSYVFDWVSIIIIAAIGGGFNYAGTYHRPFSLVDLSISYPFVPSQIPTWLLFVIGLILPAIVILGVCILLVPGRAVNKTTPTKLIWRRKLWELNTGWMGLALSLALAFVIVQGMKTLFGKPRPDFLDRCQPDVANYRQHIIARTHYATEFNIAWALVGDTICQNPDKDLIDDGFRSFPSGHASFSWAGLFYLALFLSSKFAIYTPFAPLGGTNAGSDDPILPAHRQDTQENWTLNAIPARNRAAAPPVYLLALPLVPICVAIYVTATRFFQFHHHGFDLLFGSAVGIITAWFAFRYYHLPLSHGAGWSWGARTRDRAFIIGVGRGGYVGSEGWSAAVRSASGTELHTKGSNGSNATEMHDITGPGLPGPVEGTRDGLGTSHTAGRVV